MPSVEALLKEETHFPFMIIVNPYNPGEETALTIECAMIFMHKTVGEFNPELMLLKANNRRQRYLGALPQALINLLVDHTKTPQKFPKSATRNPNQTWQAVPFAAAPTRHWFAITKPDGAPTPSLPALHQILEEAIADKGIVITQLTPTHSKTSDTIKHLTGVYHVELEIKNMPPEAPAVSLTELKRIKINDMLWEVKLAYTVTHKLKLCTHCYDLLPRHNPATMDMPQFLEFIEQQEGESAANAAARLQLYITNAVHPACKSEIAAIRKRSNASSSTQVERIDRFKELLAKRAKENDEDADAL